MDARAGRVDLDTPWLAALASSGLLPRTVRLAVPTDLETLVPRGRHASRIRDRRRRDLRGGFGRAGRHSDSEDHGVVVRVRP